MTDAADLVLKNGEVHTLEPGGDETAEAVAVRDGRIVRIDSDYEVEFLVGVETEVIDLEGRVLLPGFIDAHTHMENFGQHLVHADLGAADDLPGALDRLEDGAREDREWTLGFGYDESEWPENRYLTREDLDAVSEDRPVAAVRVDMHTASLNSVAIERLRGEMPPEDVHTEDGDPTGVVVEDAVGPVREAVAPDYAATRDLVTAARDRAHELGVTGVHEMVRDSLAPRVYRDLAATGDLALRVRLNYWSDHLEAVRGLGLRTNSGGEMVRVGGIKSFTDGSLGGRTAKLFEPYADLEDDARGQWVVDPDELRDIVGVVQAEGLQMTTHAIGDEAIEETLSAYEAVLADEESGDADGPTGVRTDPRHRIEHVELASDDQMARMAEAGVVASVQPNFLQWAGEDGLYDQRLGRERREASNRYRDLLDAGVDLAFGSDCMPLDPLLGVDYAVNAPVEGQQITVTEALRAYTYGGAYAGFDEDRLGTVTVGKCADFTVLERSPWEHPEETRDIDVALTVVGGRVVHDGR
jgi:predicted amidohydrolase YtcJ